MLFDNVRNYSSGKNRGHNTKAHKNMTKAGFVKSVRYEHQVEKKII